MSDQQIVLSIDKRGERLDIALAQVLPDLSRSQCQQLIKSGLVTIDGRPVKVSRRLTGNEQIQVIIPEPKSSKLAPENIPLDVLFEDEDLLVIGKPAGRVVHPAAGNESGTLVNAIIYHYPDLPGIGGEKRPGIVHRLDKGTSGLIIVARNDQALRHLQAQFKERSVKKCYLALVSGRFHQREVLIDASIGRDPKDRKKMAVISVNQSTKSRPAQTRLSLIKYHADYSLVRCQPVTGRTHQIRVHLSYIGFPIVGDSLYGAREPKFNLNRTFLHAAEITFRHPSTDREISFSSELPDELSDFLSTIPEDH